LKERLEQTNIPVIYTRVSGAVKIVTDKSGWKLQTMDGQKFSPDASSAQLKHNAPAE
jgi:beta-lactamase superfamily II metal-dependent hydrolase